MSFTVTAFTTCTRPVPPLRQFTASGDHTLLVTAEQGEDVAKKSYADALEKDLPLPIRQLLAEQQAHILTSHDYVKRARDERQ